MCRVEVLGNLEKENKHQSGNIYNLGGAIAPNIMAGTHSWGMGYFLEIKKVDGDKLQWLEK